MAGMFPTMVADPNDRNRRFSGEVGDTWPSPLRTAYWFFVAAAVMMLVTGVMLLTTKFPPDLDPDLLKTVKLNTRLVAVGNIILALCLTACAAYFEKGSKRARRWASGFIFLTIFLNFAGFFVGVVGLVSIVIVGLLAFGAFFMFRPAANAFMDHKSGDLWKGVR